jgi:ATP-dependent exoDNAse (exonuclease V) beta subunit
MLRGRVDVLVPGPRQLTLVDYKTDGVSPERVPERAESYRAQLTQYADAVRAMTGRADVRSVLVFLAPRVVYEV